MRRPGGFTLIELMIVVAIIAVLAAIAIPQYQTYVAKSQVSRAVDEASSQRIVVDMCLVSAGAVLGVGGCMPTATASDVLDGDSQVGATLPDGTGVPQITLTDDTGDATIAATLGNHVSGVIDGQTATWTRDESGNWTCVFSGAAKYAPASCPGS